MKDSILMFCVGLIMLVLGIGFGRAISYSEPGYPQGFLDGMREMSEYRRWLWKNNPTDEQMDSIITALTNKANQESPND